MVMPVGKLRSMFSFNLCERDRWVARQAAQVPAGSRVLDVGAGTCPYRDLFSHCEYKPHDFRQLQPGQQRAHKGYGDIDYVSDILNIPVSSGSFDVLLCTEVLEHVPEPILSIHQFARILRPGGKLLLTAPLGSGLHQEPYHFYGGFTPYWYSKFLAEAGFEDVNIQPNGGFFKHYGQESLRFAMLLAPWKHELHSMRLLWTPFWLLSFIWLAVLCPIVCHILDRFDEHKGFTIGYHVSAVRSG